MATSPKVRSGAIVNPKPAEIADPTMMPLQLFTIGHSTHPFEEFLKLLARNGIEALADIRRFPGSRKYPHFNQDHLASTLPEANIEYRWFEALGGRRKGAGDSTRNLGLRNESFRNYADYMATQEFHEAIEQLQELARSNTTAFMCSEGLYWRCHRRLVADYLRIQGFEVRHIMPDGELRPHTLTEGARIDNSGLSYPPPQADQTQMLFD